MRHKSMTRRLAALMMAGMLAVPGQVLAQDAAASESGTEVTVQAEEAAETNPPETNPPETNPPETNPPETNPPETDPPATEAPATEAPATEAPATEAPVTEAPATENPATNGQTEGISEAGSESDGQGTEADQVTEAGSETESETEKETETESETELDREAILKDYEKSRLFSELKNRMKYSVTVPIEGIPSFITQEMVVGALKCQDEYGFPASVTIAQIIAEFGYGAYGPGGDSGQGLSQLAYEYCNLFGIKGSGTAGSVEMQTWEMKANGSTYTTSAGFRAYYTYTECINDRAEILKSGYSDLTNGVTDANTFAVQVGSRWATDAYYGKRLISIMEQYDLYRLDDMTLTDFSALMGRFANPCPGAQPTSGFGYRDFDKSFHKGLDLGTGSENIPTYAAEAGTVTYAAYDDTAGNMVIIDHGDGLVTKYMHHSELYVKAGAHVEKGQQIGLSGTTGDSTGNHLHFQVEENGVPVDPAEYLLQESQAEAPAASEEKQTESETESETEGATEAESEAVTEKVTEAETETATEKETETEAVTEKVSEAEPEAATEKLTETVQKPRNSSTKSQIFNDAQPFTGGTILSGNRLASGSRLSTGTKLSSGAVLSGDSKLSGNSKLSAGMTLKAESGLSSEKASSENVSWTKKIKVPMGQVMMIALWPLEWIIS